MTDGSSEDDLYTATPRPERRHRTVNIPEPELPRIDSTAGPSKPGKKLLASVSRGSDILRYSLEDQNRDSAIIAKYKDMKPVVSLLSDYRRTRMTLTLFREAGVRRNPKLLYPLL